MKAKFLLPLWILLISIISFISVFVIPIILFVLWKERVFTWIDKTMPIDSTNIFVTWAVVSAIGIAFSIIWLLIVAIRLLKNEQK